jgi:hypothetical protein
MAGMRGKQTSVSENLEANFSPSFIAHLIEHASDLREELPHVTGQVLSTFDLDLERWFDLVDPTVELSSSAFRFRPCQAGAPSSGNSAE